MKEEEEEEEEKEQAEEDDGCCRAQTLGKLCNFPFALQLCRGNSKGKVSGGSGQRALVSLCQEYPVVHIYLGEVM